MSVAYPDLPFTNFPDVLDTIDLKSNITNATDSALVQQIQQYIVNGDFSSASNLIAENTQLNGKIFNSNDYNKLRDAVLALERLYKDDLETYVTNKQTEWESNIDRFSYIGVFNPATQYYKNNLVNYTTTTGTFLFICIESPQIGTLPTNTTYWRTFTVSGERGESGDNLSFTYLYNPTMSYSVGDVVIYLDKWWGAIQSNVGQVPYEGSPYWSVILTSLPAKQIPIQASEPLNPIVGDLWYQVI